MTKIIISLFFLIIINLLFFCDVVHTDTMTSIPTPLNESSGLKRLVVGLGISLGVLAGLVIWYCLDTANKDLYLALVKDVCQLLQEYSLDLYHHCWELIINSGGNLEVNYPLLAYCLSKIVTISHDKFAFGQLLQES